VGSSSVKDLQQDQKIMNLFNPAPMGISLGKVTLHFEDNFILTNTFCKYCALKLLKINLSQILKTLIKKLTLLIKKK
jgi:hypothetical protein